jgi:hypothetical protein
MLAPPRRSVVTRRPDRLVDELDRVEGPLQTWIAASGRNARLFRQDPMAAMREAGLEIEDDLLCELEQLMSGIAAKFRK